MRTATLLLAALISTQAGAVETSAPGRYAFVPAEKGTLRLDTVTGAVSLCAGDAQNLACTLLPDDAADRTAEQSRLEERVKTLEEQVATLQSQASATSN